MNSLNETWKAVKGYEGLYEVSDHGRVRSLGRDMVRRDGYRYVMPQRILRHWLTRGYPTVSLSRDGKVKKLYVHRLVASAFLPMIRGKREVNHLDVNPQNNLLSNLEWVTPSENVTHSYRAGKHRPIRGESFVGSKLTDQAVRDIRRLYPGVSGPKLGARYGVASQTIYRVVNGDGWKHVQ